MMNGGGSTLYEEPPPPPTIPLSHIKSSPSPSTTPVIAASSTVASGTSSTSPSSVTSNSGPLHIPAKRLVSSYSSADCVDGASAGSGGASNSASGGGGSVIRHPHHGSQPWNYSPVEHPSPATAFDQYNSAAATYSNLVADPIGSRDGRKPAGSLFWSPAAAAATSAANSAPEYKYSPAGAGAGGCGEQPAFAQSWCGYSAYSPHSRHYPESHHSHHAQPVPYLSSEERIRSATESAGPFAHDSYPLRNYPPPPTDPLSSTPYAPPGMSNHHLFVRVYFFLHQLDITITTPKEREKAVGINLSNGKLSFSS